MAVDVPFQPAVPEIVSTYQQQYISSRHAEEEEDEPRSSKRFRTSSEAPYAAADIEEGLDEGEDDLFDLHLHSIEADPNGDEWDDLDADDGDDTIMVNEYVVEIFEYLKQNEVSFPTSTFIATEMPLAAVHPAESELHAFAQGTILAHAWRSPGLDYWRALALSPTPRNLPSLHQPP